MMTAQRPLVVTTEHDTNGIALNCAKRLVPEPDRTALTLIDVNDFLDHYVDVLQDIVDKNELRSLVLIHRRKQLIQLLQRCHLPSGERYKVEVLQGVPFVEIIKHSISNHHDMIIKLAEPSEDQHNRALGSSDMHLLRKSPMPVVVVNQQYPQQGGRIIALVDVSNADMMALNQRIVDQAAAAAERFECRLDLLTTWRLPGEATMRHNPLLKIDEARISSLTNRILVQTEDSMQALAGRVGRATALKCNPAVHILKGEPGPQVREFIAQHNTQLLVLGTLSHASTPGLYIDTAAETILNSINCSVMALKPDDFVSPVSAVQDSLKPEQGQLALA